MNTLSSLVSKSSFDYDDAVAQQAGTGTRI